MAASPSTEHPRPSPPRSSCSPPASSACSRSSLAAWSLHKCRDAFAGGGLASPIPNGDLLVEFVSVAYPAHPRLGAAAKSLPASAQTVAPCEALCGFSAALWRIRSLFVLKYSSARFSASSLQALLQNN